MKELDDEKLELLERQLAERITERVRGSLFRLYATAGLAVIGVVGFIGWDVVTDIKADITTQVLKDIDADIKAKRTEILEQVTETRVVAQQANDIIKRVDKQLLEFAPQAEDLNKTIETVRDLNVDSRNFLTIYENELKPVIATVDSLNSQLGVLAEQVKQLNAIAVEAEPGATTEPPQTVQKRNQAIQSMIAETKEAEERLVEARKQNTVFFQFAGARREQAEELSAALKNHGYVVPGEDRERGATNKHEIRYFHDEDKDAAVRLAEVTTREMRDLGYQDSDVPDVVAKSLVSYRGKKPRIGVLELWLEIPDQR